MTGGAGQGTLTGPWGDRRGGKGREGWGGEGRGGEGRGGEGRGGEGRGGEGRGGRGGIVVEEAEYKEEMEGRGKSGRGTRGSKEEVGVEGRGGERDKEEEFYIEMYVSFVNVWKAMHIKCE